MELSLKFKKTIQREQVYRKSEKGNKSGEEKRKGNKGRERKGEQVERKRTGMCREAKEEQVEGVT